MKKPLLKSIEDDARGELKSANKACPAKRKKIRSPTKSFLVALSKWPNTELLLAKVDFVTEHLSQLRSARSMGTP
ncbi:hypothetical protein O9929_27005 [Vibrio lentus]|nr:hypothetical protein [Vibrio lentus]